MIPELATYEWMQAFGPHGAAQEEGSSLKGDEADAKALTATARAAFCQEDLSSGDAGETKVVGFCREDVVLLAGTVEDWDGAGGAMIGYCKDGRWCGLEAWRCEQSPEPAEGDTDWGDTSSGNAFAAATLTAVVGAFLNDDQIRAMGLDHGRVSALEEQAAGLPKFVAPTPAPAAPTPAPEPMKPRQIDPEEVRAGGYVPVSPDDLALGEELVKATLELVHFSDDPTTGETTAHTDEAEIRVARMVRAAFDVRNGNAGEVLGPRYTEQIAKWRDALEACLDFGVRGSTVVRPLVHILDEMEKLTA